MIEKKLPLVTFVIFSYNQENFIKEAVDSALSQDYSPLEVIISDDCSSDKTFELIKKIVSKYNGPHNIIVNKNTNNIGLINHVNSIFEMANGQFIIAAAGDDISLPERTSILTKIFIEKNPMLIHSSVIKIDVNGNEIGLMRPPININSIFDASTKLAIYIGASGAWNKSLYNKFGPIKYTNSYEDLVLGFRAHLNKSIEFIDKPLVRYRIGTGLSTRSIDLSSGFSILINEKIRKINVIIDTLNQRLTDIDINSAKLQDEINIKLKIKNLIKIYTYRIYFYKNKKFLIKNLISKDIFFVLKAFFFENYFLLKSHVKYFCKNFEK